MSKHSIQIVIIEDEPVAAKNLKSRVHEILPNANILTIIDTVSDAIAWFSKKKADLVLMDIHLADGSSFEIFEQVKIETPIIFTTAYDQYAIHAFKVNSIDYLLKPIKTEELKLALDKFDKLYQNNTAKAYNFEEIAELFTQPRKYKKRITVQAGSLIKTIPTNEIALFYVLDGIPFLLTKTNKTYDLSLSLDKLQLVLDPEYFFRINRQMIVNFEAIKEMYHLSKSRIGIKLLVNFKDEVLVSFRKMPEFREWIDR